MTNLELCPFCGSSYGEQHNAGCYIKMLEFNNSTKPSLQYDDDVMERAWNVRYKRTCKPTIKERHIMAGGEEYSFWQAICDCGWIVGEDGTPNLSEFKDIDNYCGNCGVEVINEP